MEGVGVHALADHLHAFDVLEACKDLAFETIFVTAYSEYSLRALNMSAAFYLLKPISIEELIVTIATQQSVKITGIPGKPIIPIATAEQIIGTMPKEGIIAP